MGRWITLVFQENVLCFEQLVLCTFPRASQPEFTSGLSLAHCGKGNRADVQRQVTTLEQTLVEEMKFIILTSRIQPQSYQSLYVFCIWNRRVSAGGKPTINNKVMTGRRYLCFWIFSNPYRKQYSNADLLDRRGHGLFCLSSS